MLHDKIRCICSLRAVTLLYSLFIAYNIEYLVLPLCSFIATFVAVVTNTTVDLKIYTTIRCILKIRMCYTHSTLLSTFISEIPIIPPIIIINATPIITMTGTYLKSRSRVNKGKWVEKSLGNGILYSKNQINIFKCFRNQNVPLFGHTRKYVHNHYYY